MATAQQKASPGVYVTDDVGLEVTDGTNSRVLLGLITGTNGYGLKVVAADGTTVIIDGTSDMFKILQTGTMTNAGTNSQQTSATVTLSSLGTFTTTPAHLCMLNLSSSTPATSAPMQVNPALSWSGVGLSFVAATSGGAVTTREGALKFNGEMYTTLSASQCVVTFIVNNYTNVDNPSFGRYYILAEAAL